MSREPLIIKKASVADRDLEQRETSQVGEEEEKFMGVRTGIVKSFGEYSKPGFGHLLDSNNNEYFCHFSSIVGSGFKNLARGQHVKFHAYEGPKGLYAKEVRVIMV